jgi:threonyl-tRNA synthetase
MSKANIQYETLQNKQKHLFKVRHTAEHVLMMAVKKLYPEMKMAMGPATNEGFYFDVDLGENKLTEQDFKKLEKEMYRIINSKLKVQKSEIKLPDAQKLFKNNEYKQEWLDEIKAKGEKATIYTIGKGTKDEFVDLCSGPHVKTTDEIKVIKLLSVAGAYWRGDENNKMLTRIYGTAFESKDDLKDYLWKLEEAKKRDHKKLGKELDLFSFSEKVGSGLALWSPKGTLIRTQLDDFCLGFKKKYGYQKVTIPHITKKDLYETSGHWEKFKDELFIIHTREGHQFAMKPMNCPHHTQIYDSHPRSYKGYTATLLRNNNGIP